jgi:hypothetical protein
MMTDQKEVSRVQEAAVGSTPEVTETMPGISIQEVPRTPLAVLVQLIGLELEAFGREWLQEGCWDTCLATEEGKSAIF